MSDAAVPDVNALVARLGSDDPNVRGAAAERLASMGEDAAPAAAPLVRACGDAEEQVREQAVAALEDLGPPPAEAISQLIKLVPAFKSAPTFAVTNLYLLLQMQTPLMATLGNVNPSSAFASLLVHQQPAITLSQISGNALAVAFCAAVNHFIISHSADTRQKVKQD